MMIGPEHLYVGNMGKDMKSMGPGAFGNTEPYWTVMKILIPALQVYNQAKRLIAQLL